MRTTGKQCGLAATGDYQPSLRSPWLAAFERDFLIGYADIIGGTLAPLDAVRDAFVRGMRDGWLELKEQ